MERLYVNPLTRITLHFKDGAALDFLMDKPIPQVAAMVAVGRLLGETHNTLNIDLPEAGDVTFRVSATNGHYRVRVEGKPVLDGGTLEQALAAVADALPRT